MKLLLVTLALASTTVQAGFLTTVPLGTVNLPVNTPDHIVGTLAASSSLSGVVEIPADVSYLFSINPLGGGGAFQLTFGANVFNLGPTPEVINAIIPQGTYAYSLVANTVGADFDWQLITNGVPDSGDFFLGWVGLLGAMMVLRYDSKRS